MFTVGIIQPLAPPTSATAKVSFRDNGDLPTLVGPFFQLVAMEAGRWKIYVENVADSGQKSDLLCTVSSRQEVVKYVGRFIQFYRENRRYSERTYDFVKRVTIEKVRHILVEDSNGICSRLDGEIQGAVQPIRGPVQLSPELIHLPQFVELFERKRHTA